MERYTQWAKDEGIQELVTRLETLQDMLYQQKEASDVNLLVDSSQQIRNLTMELSGKTALIDQLRMKLEELCVSCKDVKRDDDLATFLGNVIKEKEKQLELQKVQIMQSA